VVRHLEQVGGDRRVAGQEIALDLGLDVAGEEDGAPAMRHPQDERLVVGSQPLGRDAAGVGDIEARAAEVNAHAAPWPQYGDPEIGGGRFEAAHGGVAGRQSPEPQRRRSELRQDRRGAADVVAVRVGHGHDVETQNPHGAKGRGDHPRTNVEVGYPQAAGIDQHGRARRGAHEDGIPLPDIERHDLHPSARGAPVRRDVEAAARQQTERQKQGRGGGGAPRPRPGRATRRRHGGEQGEDQRPGGRHDPQASRRQAGAGRRGAVDRLEQDARERDRLRGGPRQRRCCGQRHEAEQQAGRRRRHRH
jgi:hypothetical protein